MATRGTSRTNVGFAGDCGPGHRRKLLRSALALALLVGAWWGATWAQDGARIFQRCFACHSLDPAATNVSGPTLRGIFGRRAGTLADFDYSPAIRDAGRHGLVWTGEALDRFLEDPENLVPGVRMGGVRMRDMAERRALIEWLQRVTR
jgi:cytochrome c